MTLADSYKLLLYQTGLLPRVALHPYGYEDGSGKYLAFTYSDDSTLLLPLQESSKTFLRENGLVSLRGYSEQDPTTPTLSLWLDPATLLYVRPTANPHQLALWLNCGTALLCLSSDWLLNRVRLQNQ